MLRMKSLELSLRVINTNITHVHSILFSRAMLTQYFIFSLTNIFVTVHKDEMNLIKWL